MRALTVAPGIANSARVEDVPEPPVSDGAVLVRTLALGVCGTDREIVSGDYGWAPPGQKRLVIGHESLGKVAGGARRLRLSNPAILSSASCGGPIRCRVPCCAVGEWDMCRNGRYTERGIKERNGYGSDFFRIEPEFLIKLDPSLGLNGVLVEPTSVVAKAWDHTERIGPPVARLGAEDASCHRRRPDRSSCRNDRRAARARSPRARSSRKPGEEDDRARTRRHISSRQPRRSR